MNKTFVLVALGAISLLSICGNTEEVKLGGEFTADDLSFLATNAQKHEFKAEVNRLMDLLVHSLYTNKEVFLRELISNGSDALDKLRFLALTNSTAFGAFGDILEILVRAVREDGTLRIRDTGIGMTGEELVKNLGTVAQSGTLEFLKQQAKASENGENPTSLIGQFGVGFYAAFLVSDRVTVVSKSNDDPIQHVWESDANGVFTISADPRGNTLGRGTEVILHLKDSEKDKYLDNNVLSSLIKKYSEFVVFPIKLWVQKTVPPTPVPEEEDIEENKEEEEAVIGEKNEENEEEKKEPVVEWDWEIQNNVKPIWMRNPKEVTEEEYNSFYKAITGDYENPLAYSHFKAEGDADFRAILFIPSNAPSDLWDPSPDAHTKDLRLFVKHVFVTGMAIDVVPPWLRFVRGVVDSEDLPINIGREQVQESHALDAIRQKVIRKSIAMFQELFKNDREGKYKKFYEQYSTAIKIGCSDDMGNRERLEKILLFHSSKVKNNMTTFSEYLDRLEELNKDKPKELRQSEILYIGGESMKAVERSPLLERLVRSGHEVIYCIDPIDEYLFNTLGKVDKIQLTNIAREGLSLPWLIDENKEKLATESISELTSWLESKLKESVSKVVASTKLMTTPATVVSSQYGPTSNMERIMRAQALAKNPNAKNPYGFGKRVLEINPGHPMIKELHKKVHAALEAKDDKHLEAMAHILYHSGLVSGGFSLDDVSHEFTQEINMLMSFALGVDPKEEVTQVNLEKEATPEQPQTEEKKEL